MRRKISFLRWVAIYLFGVAACMAGEIARDDDFGPWFWGFAAWSALWFAISVLLAYGGRFRP